MRKTKVLYSFCVVFLLLSFLPLLIHAVTVGFTTVNITSIHTCPLDQRTFVIAYHDETNDDFSFQIYDTNGTQILAETDVDTTSGGSMYDTTIGVGAFNSTTFVLGWYDKTDLDATFAVYNITGSLLSGPTDVDTDIGAASQSVQVSCFNSTYFVIGWIDDTDKDATFAIYDSSSNLIAGPIDADTDVGSSTSISVSAFNSTVFVVGWFDATDKDATFAIYDTAGSQIGTTIDADTDVNSFSFSVSVSTLNSTYFVIGWYDYTDLDATFSVYDSTGTLKTGPIDADTAANYPGAVQVSALNSTAFVMSWYDGTDFDLSYGIYFSNGTSIVTNATDIESWPTAANAPFVYHSPCSQQTANNIKLYNDNWIIAYANTTTQAIWQAFTPAGAVWDGTIPSQGQDYPIALNTTATITLTTLIQVTHGLPENLTGIVTFTTSIQVSYHVSMDETNSLLLNLTGESELETPSNVSGVITFSTIVETSYHITSTETCIVNMNTSIIGNLSLEKTGNGTITLNTVVQVGYHVTTVEVQTLTLSQSKTANCTKPLSLMPYFALSVSISGNFSSPTSSGSNGTGGTGPQASGNVFDVRIVRLAYVFRFEQTLRRSVSVTVNVTNVGTTSGDAVWDWWVDGASQDKLVSRTETGFVGAGQSNLFTCTFDLEQGDYVFNAEAKSIAGNVLSSRAMASLAFSVGYIYADFMKDNFVLILIVCFTVIICILSYRRRKRKHSRNSRRKRKSHRR